MGPQQRARVFLALWVTVVVILITLWGCGAPGFRASVDTFPRSSDPDPCVPNQTCLAALKDKDTPVEAVLF
jgi:hypothetical protein